jgi:hypothetical protein
MLAINPGGSEKWISLRIRNYCLGANVGILIWGLFFILVASIVA